MEIKNRGMYVGLIGMLVVTGILGGGYFGFASSIVSVLGLIFISVFLIKNQKFQISWCVSSISIYVFAIMYFVVCIWAIDQGMALMGALKILPVAIFLFLICQNIEEREKIINLLPMLGSLMTLFSFVMMQFAIFKPIVSVAGRLAGFFQYPNTYALFMLVCLVISIWRVNLKKVDWIEIVYIVLEVFGIYMSGSRIVFALTLFTIVLVAAMKREKIKTLIAILLTLALAGAVLFFTEGGREVILRIFGVSTGFSTLFGRMLYVQDALELILKHPFGMGYYGYYFTQQEIQTGVYSVVNVHNELVQTMLDIGIIPGVLFYIGIMKSIVSSRVDKRNKIVLLIILLHSLLDYDFQFLAMWYVLILFLDFRGIREYKISNVTKVFVSVMSLGIIWGTTCVGLSDWFYVTNNYKYAEKVYEGNTLAKIAQLSEIKSMEKLQEKAEEILEENKHVAIAYSAKARALFSQGDVEGFIKNKLTTLRIAPYQYEEYTDYLVMLSYCVEEYSEQKDWESAKMCLQRAEAVPGMLDETKKKTSALGWKIKDKPKLTLSRDYLELIEQMKEAVNE